jgi:hypothetical protein
VGSGETCGTGNLRNRAQSTSQGACPQRRAALTGVAVEQHVIVVAVARSMIRLVKWEYETLGAVMHGAAFQWLTMQRADPSQTKHGRCTGSRLCQNCSRGIRGLNHAERCDGRRLSIYSCEHPPPQPAPAKQRQLRHSSMPSNKYTFCNRSLSAENQFIVVADAVASAMQSNFIVILTYFHNQEAARMTLRKKVSMLCKGTDVGHSVHLGLPIDSSHWRGPMHCQHVSQECTFHSFNCKVATS